ncbi:MAG: tetratricopeptide repeat protein, partial [Candidatus Omnitrophica bacterium]|nr:tetratricopeptide repeat protein [Candidatus Omnitrophota bacterium]
GELEDALRHYRGALHLARDLFDESTVRNNLGNLYLLVKQPEEAMAQFRRCLEILPWGPADFYNNIGLAYLDLGDLRKAEESYVRSLDANRLYVPAYMNLGVLRFRQARWEEGGRLFEQAVRLDPDDALAMLGLGKFYLSMGEFDKASETFRRLVRLRPNEPTGYLYLAVCAMRTAPPQLEAAHRYLARATALGWEPDAAFLAELKKIGK